MGGLRGCLLSYSCPGWSNFTIDVFTVALTDLCHFPWHINTLNPTSAAANIHVHWSQYVLTGRKACFYVLHVINERSSKILPTAQPPCKNKNVPFHHKFTTWQCRDWPPDLAWMNKPWFGGAATILNIPAVTILAPSLCSQKTYT